MDQQRVDIFIMTNAKYFPEDKIFFLKEKLKGLSDDKFAMLTAISLKDPTTTVIISVLLGSLGIDRFMIGDTGLGVLKLLTGGCCGILTIIDWFTISGKTKEKNFNKIMTLL